MDVSTNPKKRQRSVPGESLQCPETEQSQCFSLSLRLQNPLTCSSALNDLLELTSSHEKNFSLDGDHIIVELTRVFFKTIKWKRRVTKDTPHFRSENAWTGYASNHAGSWAAFCRSKFSDGSLSIEDRRCLESIVVVLRNLSFVAVNLRLLAYSPAVLSILAGLLYERPISNSLSSGDDTGMNSNSLALPALHTLVNLAPYLDVTGQKLFCDKLFLSGAGGEDPIRVPSPSTFGQAADGSWGFGSLWLAKRLDTKEDLVQDVSKTMLLQLTKDYLEHVWAIFPALESILTDATAPRLVTIMAVDLLQEFMDHARATTIGKIQEDVEVASARSILANIPMKVLQRLMDLLYVPRLRPDSLEYIDPVQRIVTRVTTLKLLMGYDATVDTDVRDRALDALVALLELDSPQIAKKLGTERNGAPRIRLFDAIIPILATQVGRNEAPLLAVQLLRELSRAPENRVGCEFIQERILLLASGEPRLAHLAFNHLYLESQEE